MITKKKPKNAPLAPPGFPDMPIIPGVRLASASCGLKYKGRKDLFLAVLDKGTHVAGVFTQSKTAAAPVHWCKRQAGRGRARALIVNAGNANAFTGRSGVVATEAITHAVADQFGIAVDRVFSSATGVIGEPLPYARLVAALPDLYQRLAPAAAAQAQH